MQETWKPIIRVTAYGREEFIGPAYVYRTRDGEEEPALYTGVCYMRRQDARHDLEAFIATQRGSFEKAGFQVEVLPLRWVTACREAR